MKAIIIVVIIFIILFIIYKFIDYKLEINNLKKQNAILTNRCKQYYAKLIFITKYNAPYMYNIKSSNTKNQDVIEAVKFARNKAHPDNGGTNEEFIKFNKLYQELVR